MLEMSLCVITVCILLPGDKACCHLMPCCFVLCFQGKARCESAEGKVSTALILHGDLGLLGGNNETLRSDLFFLFSFTNTRALGLLRVCSFMSKHLLLTSFSNSRRHTRMKRSTMALPGQTSYCGRLAHSSQVINTSSARSWMSDSWWGHCHPYLSFTPFLPPLSDVHGAVLSSLAFVSHSALFAPVTGCSDIDNSVSEDRLNFCVYGCWLCAFPIQSHRSQQLKVFLLTALTVFPPDRRLLIVFLLYVIHHLDKRPSL